MRNGKPVGFATRYAVYLTSLAKRRWKYVGTLRTAVNAQGIASIQLPSSYSVSEVMIVPEVLGRDEHGHYVFQLADINLGR